MRDLARALSNIKLFHYDESFVAVCDERNGILTFPLGLVYEAIERAIKAEAENAKLRRAVDTARVLWWGADINQWKTFDQAIAELDEEK